ncbi:MAG: ATP-binding cassette domain-containing protein [Syntrophobacterales bacterium]|nr:ATP-binding cassette domain-containing protein [Syntrophobacterales bacterium]
MDKTSMVSASSIVVKVWQLSKAYRNHRAIENVSLEIRRGEIFGLIGPDGAGKSTLMKIVAGVLSFDKGTVRVFDIDLNSETSAERIKQRIGFMPQGLGLNLYADLSVEENIDFFARLRDVRGGELKRRKEKLLAMTRLDRFTDRPMKHLSGGMKQKLGLICTLIHEPELIILDEPTTGVDPVSRRDFWEILTELIHYQNITAIVSTAYLDEAERFHRLAFMYGGKVIGDGDPETLRASFPKVVIEVATQDQVEVLERLRSVFPQVNGLGGRIRVFADRTISKGSLDRIFGEIGINHFEEVEPSLEDVFAMLIEPGSSNPQLDRTRGKVVAPRLNEDLPSKGKHTFKESIPNCHGETVIEAYNLTRDFGSFRAVDNVSFEVRRGEIFGLLGANGAGKTTLIKMLTGILSPTSGEGKVAGSDIRRAGREVRERIGYVSQSFSLYQDLTVVENMRLFAGIYGISGKRASVRIEEVSEMTGLGGYEKELAKRLPMGIRQRLALACAIIHFPEILFLDEPTSGVDPLGRRRFWSILSNLVGNEKVAILITTHYMSEAEHCDRLALMHGGRIVANDSPVALKAQLRADIGELLVVKARNLQKVLGPLRSIFPNASFFGNKVHVFASDPERAKDKILETVGRDEIVEITSQDPTLEDVFVFRITQLERMERT